MFRFLANWKDSLSGITLRQFFKLLLLPWLSCCVFPACANQNDQSCDGISKSEKAHEERLWNAQKTLEAGNLEEAAKLYRAVLKLKKDDPRALLGLARVFQKQARRDGVCPPGMAGLMKKMQSIIDAQGNGVAKMQERLRRQTDTSTESGWKYGNSNRARDAEPSDSDIRKRWKDRTMPRSAHQNSEEYFSRVDRIERRSFFGSALLLRRDCPEPIYKDWYFLDPPS